jgi:hypothetical protein
MQGTVSETTKLSLTIEPDWDLTLCSAKTLVAVPVYIPFMTFGRSAGRVGRHTSLSQEGI